MCVGVQLQITAFQLVWEPLEGRDSFCCVASPRTGPRARKIMIECYSAAFKKGNAECPEASKALALCAAEDQGQCCEWQSRGTAPSPDVGASPAQICFPERGEESQGPTLAAFLREASGSEGGAR